MNGATPFVIFTFPMPFAPPTEVVELLCSQFKTIFVGSATVVVADIVQPLASVTIYVTTPALAVNTPKPVYGASPPVAETVTFPVPLLQSIGVLTCNDTFIALGSVTVIEVELLQLLASVTV